MQRGGENLMTVEFFLFFYSKKKQRKIIFSFTKAAFIFQGFKKKNFTVFLMIYAKNEEKKVCE